MNKNSIENIFLALIIFSIFIPVGLCQQPPGSYGPGSGQGPPGFYNPGSGGKTFPPGGPNSPPPAPEPGVPSGGSDPPTNQPPSSGTGNCTPGQTICYCSDGHIVCNGPVNEQNCSCPLHPNESPKCIICDSNNGGGDTSCIVPVNVGDNGTPCAKVDDTPVCNPPCDGCEVKDGCASLEMTTTNQTSTISSGSQSLQVSCAEGKAYVYHRAGQCSSTGN